MPQPQGLQATYTKDGTSERTVDTYALAAPTKPASGEGNRVQGEQSIESAMAQNNARFQAEGMPK